MKISATENPHKAERELLLRDGICIIKDVLAPEDLNWVRDEAVRIIPGISQQHRREQLSTGSMVASGDMPSLARLFVWPKAIRALENLGFEDFRFVRAYLISKPPHSPRLFWHQDCMNWVGEPRAYSDIPTTLFLMYYLTDTRRKNGCLRVIPGSHRKRHLLHDQIGTAHTDDSRQMTDPDSPLYRTVDDEIDVPVKAGDLLIGDSRALHASHANETDEERTVITVFYHPFFCELTEASQRLHADQSSQQHDHWPAKARKIIEPYMATYSGTAEPLPKNRIPGPQLV